MRIASIFTNNCRIHLLQRLLPWLAAGVAFVFYAQAAAPSIVALFDDSLEFQLVLPTLRIAHPTGYPLYTLLGALWSRVLWPFGNWAWRVNLFSALAAASAVGLVCALAQRITSSPHGRVGVPAGPARGRAGYAGVQDPHVGVRATRGCKQAIAGAVAALVFGLGPVWMAQATVAEVYALHNLLLAAVLLVTVSVPALAEAREPAQTPSFLKKLGILDHETPAPFVWYMALLTLLVGLGLAHHRTIVLALPGVLVYLLWSVPRLWRPRWAWLLWLAALLLPLLLYFYLPLRAAAGAADLHGSYTNTWSGFWEHVLARGYGGFFAPSALSVERSPQDWLALVLAQVGWIGGALALVGCAGLFDGARRKEWVLVLLVLGVNLVFALLYRVADQEVFLLPVFLCLALLAGGGAGIVVDLVGRGARGVRTGQDPPTHPLIALALLALLLWNPGRGPLTNRSGDWAVHDYAVDMAKVDFPPGAVVLGLEGEATALKYMQAAAGLGTNATPVAADDPAQRRALLDEAVTRGSAAYLTRELEGIGAAYSFGGDGPLVRVWPRGGAQAGAPQHLLEESMAGGRLRLAGYDLQRLDWAGGPALRLTLYWQPTVTLTQTFKTSIRLLGVDGAPLTYAGGAPAVFDQLPLRGVALTPDWLPGETVRDAYAFYLPPAAQGGGEQVTLQVIVYDAETVAEVGRWAVNLPMD